MAEKVLNNPLTGEEIVLALADRIAQSLRRDCFLNPHTAYEFYEAKIHIEVKMNDAGLSEREVKQTILATEGVEPEDGVDGVVGDLIVVPKPPNEERVTTGQPVPVLTRDEYGKTVTKHIQYARTKKPSAKVVSETIMPTKTVENDKEKQDTTATRRRRTKS